MMLLDAFCGEGGASVGYEQSGVFAGVVGVDNDPERLARYPFAKSNADALEFIRGWGHLFDFIHASPPCQGYSRATVALADRADRYDRLIAATRDALESTGKPYVIENVADARPELRDPQMLCWRMFADGAVIDDDGTPLVMDRHRLFETNWGYKAPPHTKHDRRWQVAGSYGGARRDKVEARTIRKGGYVPQSLAVQQELLGTPWMSERGCWLSIPPTYTRTIALAWACAR